MRVERRKNSCQFVLNPGAAADHVVRERFHPLCVSGFSVQLTVVKCWVRSAHVVRSDVLTISESSRFQRVWWVHVDLPRRGRTMLVNLTLKVATACTMVTCYRSNRECRDALDLPISSGPKAVWNVFLTSPWSGRARMRGLLSGGVLKVRTFLPRRQVASHTTARLFKYGRQFPGAHSTPWPMFLPKHF